MKLINNINYLFLAFGAGAAFSSFGIQSVAGELWSRALPNHQFSASSISLAQQSTCFSCFESDQSLVPKSEILTHHQPVNDEPKIPADAGGSR